MTVSPSRRQRPASQDKWTVRIGPLMALPAVLAELGVDAVSTLREVGLSPEDFSDPEHTIAFSTGDALLQLAVERSGCEHLGLLVGARAPAQSMGTVGYLMLSSGTVGEALRALAAHLEVHDRGAVVRLREEENLAILSYALVAPGLRRADQILALSLAVGRNILRGLCGPQWLPHAVSFSFARPRSVTPYRQCFGVTPLFDAHETALVFPARQLQQRLPGADHYLHHLMRERVLDKALTASGDFVDEVRRILRGRPSPGHASLADVAAEIGLHEKTLKRRLAAQGTRFREVRDAVLFQTAKDLLRSTGLNTSEIASAVGYSDPAAFTRAFTRWSGLPPSQWRAHGPEV